MYIYTSIFLWHCANVHVYVYFLVAQRQCLPLRVFSRGTASLHALNVCILIVLKVSLVQLLLPSPLPLPRCGEGGEGGAAAYLCKLFQSNTSFIRLLSFPV